MIAIDGTVYRDSCAATSPTPNALGQEFTESQHRYQDLLSSLPGAVYRCRNERGWPIDFISEGCHQLTGYDPNAFIVGGVNWGADIIHPDDRETVWKQVQDSLQVNEPFHLTYRLRTASGEQKQVWGKGSGVFKQGEVVALTGFITDITNVRNKQRVPEEA